MLLSVKSVRTAVAALAAGLFAVAAWAVPAQAQGGSRYGWGYSYAPVVVHRPVVRRTLIVERPVVRPRVVYETVIVRRPRVVRHVIVRRPAHVHRVRYVSHPVYGHHRPWRERPRCYLPERWLCR